MRDSDVLFTGLLSEDDHNIIIVKRFHLFALAIVISIVLIHYLIDEPIDLLMVRKGTAFLFKGRSIDLWF